MFGVLPCSLETFLLRMVCESQYFYVIVAVLFISYLFYFAFAMPLLFISIHLTVIFATLRAYCWFHAFR